MSVAWKCAGEDSSSNSASFSVVYFAFVPRRLSILANLLRNHLTVVAKKSVELACHVGIVVLEGNWLLNGGQS